MNKERCLMLGINNEDEYKNYENKYKKVFEEYILSKIDMNKYNDDIEQSELGFGKVDKKIETKYGLEEFWNLNHFYILNNFHIDKLQKEDIDILDRGSNIEQIELIEKTYKNIILDDNNQPYKVNHTNSTALSKFSNNDELVIVIYYGNNTKKYDNKDTYIENYIEKKKYLNKIIKKLTLEFKEKLDINIMMFYEKV